MCVCFRRLPEGQAELGVVDAGKLRHLEEQLIRAKEQINSYRSLPGDGETDTSSVLNFRMTHTHT